MCPCVISDRLLRVCREQEPIRPTNPRPVGASTLASEEFLADFAPQYVAGEFPA